MRASGLALAADLAGTGWKSGVVAHLEPADSVDYYSKLAADFPLVIDWYWLVFEARNSVVQASSEGPSEVGDSFEGSVADLVKGLYYL